jgi:hypothetical protein
VSYRPDKAPWLRVAGLAVVALVASGFAGAGGRGLPRDVVGSNWAPRTVQYEFLWDQMRIVGIVEGGRCVRPDSTFEAPEPIRRIDRFTVRPSSRGISNRGKPPASWRERSAVFERA